MPGKVEAALEWYFRAGANPKKLKFLINMQQEGHKVPLLENQPLVTPLEAAAIEAGMNCETIKDLQAWGNIHSIGDLELFVDLAIHVRKKVVENAQS